ncbi:serine hydrolase domain-containing protein, partial [Glycomyces tenuis]
YPSLAEGDISDIREGYRTDYEPEELIGIATEDPLLFEPGTGYSYSNAGYMVLGLLIEGLTGNTLGHELEARILEPAGLDRTYFLDEHRDGIRGPHPVPYITTGESDEPYFDTTALSTTQLWAGGGIVSTMGDMNDFYDALTDGTLLTDEQLAEATDFVDTGSDFQYGLGLFGQRFGCPDDPEEVFIGHTGDALGHELSSFHSIDGERQVTVAWNIGDKHGYTDPDTFDETLRAFLVAGLCGTDPE